MFFTRKNALGNDKDMFHRSDEQRTAKKCERSGVSKIRFILNRNEEIDEDVRKRSLVCVMCVCVLFLLSLSCSESFNNERRNKKKKKRNSHLTEEPTRNVPCARIPRRIFVCLSAHIIVTVWSRRLIYWGTAFFFTSIFGFSFIRFGRDRERYIVALRIRYVRSLFLF